jgi:hypothetical protein
VDLPLPEGPTRAIISPFFISKLIPLSISVPPSFLVIPSIEIY